MKMLICLLLVITGSTTAAQEKECSPPESKIEFPGYSVSLQENSGNETRSFIKYYPTQPVKNIIPVDRNLIREPKSHTPLFGHRKSNSTLGIVVKVVAFVALMGLTIYFLKDVR